MCAQVQLQIRQNALEAQQYMQDLFEWEKKVKEKEKGLAGGGGKAGSGGVPAPRGRAAGSQVAAAPPSLQQPGLTATTRSSSSTSATGKHPASCKQLPSKGDGAAGNAARHTYSSYSKWDKLDVDSMLEDASDEEQPPSNSTRSQADRQKQQHQPPPQQPAPPAPMPMQAPGSNAAAQVVPAPRQPSSAAGGIQLPSQSGGDAEQAHLRPVSSTYTPAAPAAAAPPSHPPIRNSEPQTSEAWRTRGNDLFKVRALSAHAQQVQRTLHLDGTCKCQHAAMPLPQPF